MEFHDLYPLFTVRSPQLVWEHEPTYLVAEILLITLTIPLLLWAAAQGRAYVFVLVASFFGGALIELFTIMAKQIGNFYHSQASLMVLGDREPVYMLCCYVLVQFLSVVLPWSCSLPAFAEACLAALLSTFLFGVLDAVGLKMLWWTWHNSEEMYVERYLGVPLVSAIWIMASTASLALVVRVILRSNFFTKTLPSPVFVLFAVFAGPFATLGVMNIPMTLVYHPVSTWLGYPASWVLTFFRVFSLVVVLYAFVTGRKSSSSSSNSNSSNKTKTTVASSSSSPSSSSSSSSASSSAPASAISSRSLGGPVSLAWQPEWPLLLIALAYLTIFLGIACAGKPELVRRTSYSQPFGPCGVSESSFWGGFTRSKYFCPEDAVAERDHYSLACLAPADMPQEGADVYTVCGVPATQAWWDGMLFYFASAYAVVLLSQLRLVSKTVHAVKEAKKEK